MKRLAACLAASAIVGSTVPATAYGIGRDRIHVAIYRGPASCDDCSEALAREIKRISWRYAVDFVGPGERLDVTPGALRRYQIYVQPGGGQDIDAAMASLGPSRVGAIRGFVARGGGYLGLCMGAYLADASNIGLIRATLDSEVRRPGFSVGTIADAAVPVRWAGRVRAMYYQDGPFLQPDRGDRAFRRIATYQSGDLAAARYSHAAGMVVLSGPHPEADAGWFEEAGLPQQARSGGAPLDDLLRQFDG